MPRERPIGWRQTNLSNLHPRLLPGEFCPAHEHDHDEVLAAARAASVPKAQAAITGVYFLLCRGEVVYVGQTINVLGRIGTHALTKDFDSFAFIPCPEIDLDALEIRFIHLLRPRLNAQRHTGSAHAARYVRKRAAHAVPETEPDRCIALIEGKRRCKRTGWRGGLCGPHARMADDGRPLAVLYQIATAPAPEPAP